MLNEKIKVRVTQTGQTMELVVFNKRADCIDCPTILCNETAPKAPLVIPGCARDGAARGDMASHERKIVCIAGARTSTVVATYRPRAPCLEPIVEIHDPNASAANHHAAFVG